MPVSIINLLKFQTLFRPVAGPTILMAAMAVFSCVNSNSTLSRLSAPSKVSTIGRLSKGVHVLELFTSEGCSSCPAADRLLARLTAERDSNVFVLSYHVDYWDYIGWKDAFGQAAFSDRQRQYAQRLGLESVYTPQVIANGREEFVGSDEKRLRASLAADAGSATAIGSSVVRIGKDDVRLTYSPLASPKMFLNVALVQAEASTVVKRGENEGKTLHHANVVRTLKTVEAQNAGTVSFHLPEDVPVASFSLIVFAQDKDSGKITGAVQMAVPLPKGV